MKTLYLAHFLPNQLIFLVVVQIYEIHVFGEAFSPLCNNCYDNGSSRHLTFK